MTTAASGLSEDDFAKDNYGETLFPRKIESALVHLRDIGEQHVDSSVKVRAWIQNARVQGKKMAFVELREEGSWSIQGLVIAGSEVSRQMVKWVGSLKPESFVSVEGTIKRPIEPVKNCRVANYELHPTKVFCEAPAPETLSLTLASANKAVTQVDEEDTVVDGVESLNVSGSAVPGASLSTHMNNPVMRKRAPVSQAISDVRMTIRKIFTEYLDARGFNLFEPPCLIGAASEGGSEVFKLPYFGKEAYLAQSAQFYKQMEIAGGRKKVYSVGPTFRAENSNTRRHMTEFFVMDLETEIEDHYHEVMYLLEDLLLHIFRQLEVRCKDQIELVRSVYPSPPFLLPKVGEEVRISFADGQKLLREEGPEEFRNVRADEDMSTPQEKALGAIIRKKYKTDFYIIDKFPESARPFYAMLDPENPAVTNAFDFFMRGQEILSGGQRIHLPGVLESRIRAKDIDPESPGIKEYLDIFRSAGVPPHGGGGIGLDRVVAWYLALPTVHLASYYPRTPKRLLP
ncbi:hypothetical protein THARTR1_10058 [Trichoderma harzianum]|uniref:Probable aspartate--tRNA ligase, cytoplasmic n=1 Tax=Trichoderma harzianum TaxID=5544 RepID=A0A2K0TUJ5_TRIHA|nr:hypothetical protein THARTR1_10058 [Trichoderma harzianum]